MSKTTKKWFITAASLLLVGCITFGGTMAAASWDFTKLSTTEYETVSHEINNPFNSISIETNTADVEFITSKNNKYSVTCHQQKNIAHKVEVRDGVLHITVQDTREWYEFIGINFDTAKITVYLPEGVYSSLLIRSATGDVKLPRGLEFNSIDISESTGDVEILASTSGTVKVKTTTGNIRAERISAGKLELSVSTGEISLSDVSCGEDLSAHVTTGKMKLTNVTAKNVKLNGSTGDTSMNGVIASNLLYVERTTGNIIFKGCDAPEIYFKTTTGDVRGSLLSEKLFLVSTRTGRKDVPNTVSGGRCEVTTGTGDIIITVG